MVYKLDEMKGRVFTLAEVAEMLGIKPDAIRRRVRLGQLPVRRPPGSEMLVDGDELAAYLLGETSPATPPKPRKAKPKAGRVEVQAQALPFNGEPSAKSPEAPATPPPPPPAPPGPTRAAKLAAALPPEGPGVIPFKLPKEANERVNAFMKHRGLTQKEITKVTGIRSDKVSRIVNGKRAITKDTLAFFEKAYGAAFVAYLAGNGPMPER